MNFDELVIYPFLLSRGSLGGWPAYVRRLRSDNSLLMMLMSDDSIPRITFLSTEKLHFASPENGTARCSVSMMEGVHEPSGGNDLEGGTRQDPQIVPSTYCPSLTLHLST